MGVNAMKETIFVELNSVPMRIKQNYRPNFGMFFLMHLLWSYQAKDGAMYQRFLFLLFAQLIPTPFVFALDIAGIVIFGIFYLIFLGLKDVLKGSKKILFKLLQRVLNIVVTMILPIIIAIIIYEKWDDIREIVEDISDFIFY